SAAPDSPRSSQSPTPEGFQGNLELELLGLANALYNLGTTVINDSTKERDRAVSISGLGERERGGGLGLGGGIGGKQNRIMIPFQILSDIDNARNPMGLTRERLERAATENQFMNGKIEGVRSYREYLNEALCLNFPDLEEYL
ncbi:hypothetical protein C8R42DRAFT_548946, partial [Lentinula raphanica]